MTKQEYQKQRQTFGRALGAVMDFMCLENSVLVDAGFFTQTEHVSMLKRGTVYLDTEKLNQIPAALIRAYQEKEGQKFIPEPVRFYSIREMTEKGLRLANLNRNALRAGLLYILETTPEQGSAKQRCVQKGFIHSKFYSFIGKPKTTLASVEQMRELLGGTQDLFELEKTGENVLQYMRDRKRYRPRNPFITDATMEAVVSKCEQYGIVGDNKSSSRGT